MKQIQKTTETGCRRTGPMLAQAAVELARLSKFVWCVLLLTAIQRKNKLQGWHFLKFLAKIRVQLQAHYV